MNKPDDIILHFDSFTDVDCACYPQETTFSEVAAY